MASLHFSLFFLFIADRLKFVLVSHFLSDKNDFTGSIDKSFYDLSNLSEVILGMRRRITVMMSTLQFLFLVIVRSFLYDMMSDANTSQQSNHFHFVSYFPAKNDLKGYIAAEIGNLNHLQIFDVGTLLDIEEFACVLNVAGSHFDNDLSNKYFCD